MMQSYRNTYKYTFETPSKQIRINQRVGLVEMRERTSHDPITGELIYPWGFKTVKI